jgi:hypothetical protein
LGLVRLGDTQCAQAVTIIAGASGAAKQPYRSPRTRAGPRRYSEAFGGRERRERDPDYRLSSLRPEPGTVRLSPAGAGARRPVYPPRTDYVERSSGDGGISRASTTASGSSRVRTATSSGCGAATAGTGRSRWSPSAPLSWPSRPPGRPRRRGGRALPPGPARLPRSPAPLWVPYGVPVRLRPPSRRRR